MPGPGRRRALSTILSGVMLVLTSVLAAGQDQGQSQSQNQQQSQSRAGSSNPMAPDVLLPADRQAQNVAIITLRTGDKPIDRVTAQSFIRRLRLAESQGADAVVVEIDTPGGEIMSVLDITHALKSSSIENTTAWINTQAISGGAIIALACREIVVNDPVTFGDAIPIAASPIGGLQELGESERAKLLIALLEDVLDSARRANEHRYVYDEQLVQAILTTGVELWLIQDRQTGEKIGISRSEYTRLFGQDPPESEPTLLASLNPGQSTPSSSMNPYPAPPGASQDQSGGAGGGSGTGSSGQPGQQGTSFEPASPRLENLVGPVSEQLERASTRPRIRFDTPDRYALVTKVMDGSGPVQMGASQMHLLNFAANDPSVNPIRDDADIKAWFNAENLRRLDPLWSEAFVQFMTNPIVRGLLLVVFLLGFFVEMLSPGLGVPGGTALLALVAMLIPPYLMGMANWWEIVAVGVGIVLIVMEIFVIPGFGVPGILGAMVLFGGFVGTFVPDQGSGLFPDSPEHQQDLLYGVATLILAIGTAGVGMFFISRHVGRVPMLSRLILKNPTDDDGAETSLYAAMGEDAPARPQVGEQGVALTTMRPVGEVELGGRVIDASADLGYIEPGQRVRVVEVNEFRTVVAAVPSETEEQPTQPRSPESGADDADPDAREDDGASA